MWEGRSRNSYVEIITEVDWSAWWNLDAILNASLFGEALVESMDFDQWPIYEEGIIVYPSLLMF
jgi:hypothetical protein